ncbi:MAG: hypothetical protein OEZ04_13200, partial [Nitrospinota bacterium]|nr:hypothetical protein [Nitrospinota bacterium]
ASAEWDAGPGRGERKIGQEAGKGRLVAVGDSDFASNASLALSANKDLFLNMASWLTESKSQVSIRAKKPEFNPLILPREDLAFIFWCCVVAFPLISVIMGTVVIFQRKRS